MTFTMLGVSQNRRIKRGRTYHCSKMGNARQGINHGGGIVWRRLEAMEVTDAKSVMLAGCGGADVLQLCRT